MLGMLGMADRLSQEDRPPLADMQGTADMQAEQPELAEEEASHPSLPPENTRNHSKLYR